MSKSRCRNAFTLIEVLIVVIIMAVLAATIIPQFTTSTKDAKQSSVKFNMHTLRSQIELYKAQHNGNFPPLANGSIPKLTQKTNAEGTVGTTADFPYGPYLEQLPPNPFGGATTVVAVAAPGTRPTAPADATGGWQYDATTGGIYPNSSVDDVGDYTKL